MNYTSNRDFRIWNYSVSHSTLLLRGLQKITDESDVAIESIFNIDIEFWDTSYIEIPDSLKGIEIREIKENIPRRLTKFIKSDSTVFQIESENQKFYIIAYGYAIGKNAWTNKDRIQDPYLEYDEIIKRYPPTSKSS